MPRQNSTILQSSHRCLRIIASVTSQSAASHPGNQGRSNHNPQPASRGISTSNNRTTSGKARPETGSTPKHQREA